ncbi:MAG: hypothetical protein RI959_1697 [Pseudomonadota bacterium]|jgi:hypothetical protein
MIVQPLAAGDRSDGGTATCPETDGMCQQQGGQCLFFHKTDEAF